MDSFHPHENSEVDRGIPELQGQSWGSKTLNLNPIFSFYLSCILPDTWHIRGGTFCLIQLKFLYLTSQALAILKDDF
jgi:hypothetical protein